MFKLISQQSISFFIVACLSLFIGSIVQAEDWPQYKFDSRHSGDAPTFKIDTTLKLIATKKTSDAIFTSPIIGDGKIFILDGSGKVFCWDQNTLEKLWTYQSPATQNPSTHPSAAGNVNNISTPAYLNGVLHVGTQSGWYLALKGSNGEVVHQLNLGEPIFSAIVVQGEKVYLSTLGSQVYSFTPQGKIRWKWDFVKERLDFHGNRWSGEDWAKRGRRATWRDQFLCSRNIAVHGKTIVLPAGGEVTWLEDAGDQAIHKGSYRGRRESPCTLGLSIGANGNVYRQWHRRDNNGSVEILSLKDGKGESKTLPGTVTSWKSDSLLSFSSVSIRGSDIYRCRPEEENGFNLHREGKTTRTSGYPSISSPILSKDKAIYGGLDGNVYLTSLSQLKTVSKLPTAFGKAVTSPVALSNGKIYFGSEDGYLYIYGANGKAQLPTDSLGLERIRTPLKNKFSDSKFDWFTNFGNFQNTNQTLEMIQPPFKVDWIRRFKGTVKHFSVCGGGRLYTHTAEGQIFAVEQTTGRLLWRRYWPGVHVSFTAPLYYDEHLYIPQAGLKKSLLRCLRASDGKLVWEAPFSGSPSWNRQLPPIVSGNRLIYLFSSGKYTADKWLFEHQSNFGFPKDHRPLLKAWDLKTGDEIWSHDFHEFGSGGDDAGMCLVDGKLYYSCYFGAKKVGGFTCKIDPQSGDLIWNTTEHFTHAGCTISGEVLKGKGTRLYLGGYNPIEGKTNRIWCLDGKDGSLVWKSDPISRAIHVVTPTPNFLFAHSQYKHSYKLDRHTGKVIGQMLKGYNCTRFTFSEPFILGSNMDIYDSKDEMKLLWTGPAVDVLMCVGAFASNGRVYYSSNGGGIQVGLLAGEEARKAKTLNNKIAPTEN